MSNLPKKVMELPLEQRALLALKAAVKKAIAESLRKGLPVYVWSGGKVVQLPAQKSRSRSRRPSRKTNRVRKAR